MRAVVSSHLPLGAVSFLELARPLQLGGHRPLVAVRLEATVRVHDHKHLLGGLRAVTCVKRGQRNRVFKLLFLNVSISMLILKFRILF